VKGGGYPRADGVAAAGDGCGTIAMCFEVESAVGCFADGDRCLEGVVWTGMAVTCAGFNAGHVCDLYGAWAWCVASSDRGLL